MNRLPARESVNRRQRVRAGKYNVGKESAHEQICRDNRDAEIVASESDSNITRMQIMLHVVVIPEHFNITAKALGNRRVRQHSCLCSMVQRWMNSEPGNRATEARTPRATVAQVTG